MKRSREAEDEPDSDCAATAESPDSDYLYEPPASKYAEIEPSDQDGAGIAMKCSLPGHKEVLSFKTYDEYQSHYQKAHTNRCLECQRNFPSSHLLTVHIEECHDSFVAVKRDKGEHTYSCFVEGCERKCRTPQKRRLHLIDKHMFPKNYYFAVTQTGIDGRRSLLIEPGHHWRRSSAGNFGSMKDTKRRSARLEAAESWGPKADKGTADDSESSDEESDTSEEKPEQRPDTEMEDLAGAMSALHFVPNSVRFGRGGGKAGFSKR